MEPEHPGNVGAVARVMGNFDFDNLVVVNPKCNINDDELINRAKHAKKVMKNIKVVKKSYLDKFDHIVATTSQLGTDYNIPRCPISPEELAKKIMPKADDKNSNIGILFGREGEGLSNDEIKKADFIVTIPTSKKYPTMNLSHSVAVLLYDLFKASSKDKIGSNIALAGKDEKKQMKKMFTKLFSQLQFTTKEKKETQEVVWKRLIGKSMMTKRESFAVMGLLRKLIKK